jgi:hypothetical protein
MATAASLATFISWCLSVRFVRGETEWTRNTRRRHTKTIWRGLVLLLLRTCFGSEKSIAQERSYNEKERRERKRKNTTTQTTHTHTHTLYHRVVCRDIKDYTTRRERERRVRGVALVSPGEILFLLRWWAPTHIFSPLYTHTHTHMFLLELGTRSIIVTLGSPPPLTSTVKKDQPKNNTPRKSAVRNIYAADRLPILPTQRV